MATEVDVIRRIFPDEAAGNFIEIGPWPDDPQYVEIRTDASKDWFGDVRLSMSKETAKALGEALIKASQE